MLTRTGAVEVVDDGLATDEKKMAVDEDRVGDENVDHEDIFGKKKVVKEDAVSEAVASDGEFWVRSRDESAHH